MPGTGRICDSHCAHAERGISARRDGAQAGAMPNYNFCASVGTALQPNALTSRLNMSAGVARDSTVETSDSRDGFEEAQVPNRNPGFHLITCIPTFGTVLINQTKRPSDEET